MLARKSSVDDTLAIVKDVDKFKDRITKLGAAKKSADASVKKAAERNKALAVESEAVIANANAEVEAAKVRIKEIDAQAGIVLRETREVEGDVARREKAMARRDDRLKQDREILKKARAAFDAEREEFTSLVARFKAAAAAACNGV